MSFMGMYMLISLLLRKYIYDIVFFPWFRISGSGPVLLEGHAPGEGRPEASFSNFQLQLPFFWQEGQTAAAVHESLMVACQVHWFINNMIYAISLDPKVIAGCTSWAIAYGFLILSSSIFFSFLLAGVLLRAGCRGMAVGAGNFKRHGEGKWECVCGARLRFACLLAAHWCLLCLVIWVCNKQI